MRLEKLLKEPSAEVLDYAKNNWESFTALPIMYFMNERKYGVTTLYTVSKKTFNHISVTLKGQDKFTFSPGQKVFILPGSTVPLEKIEQFLKNNNLTRINDLDLADVIISPDRSQKSLVSALDSSNLVVDKIEIRSVANKYDLYRDFPLWKEDSCAHIGYVIGMNDYAIYGKYGLYYTNTASNVLYPLILSVMFKIKQGIPIISENIIRNTIQVGTIIDEAVYKTLLDLLSSSDPENHLVAQKILYECDVAKSIYWLWKLISHDYEIRQNMLNRRSKECRSFMKKCNYDELASCFSIKEFANYTVTEEFMNISLFNLIKDEYKEYILEETLNQFFDIQLIVKDEFKHYD